MPGEKGCLTDTDRAFLRGEKEYDSRQALYNRRKSIRDGARGALQDFRLLADELPAEEREKIFADETQSDEPFFPHNDNDRVELRQDVTKAIEFLYAGMGGVPGFTQPLESGTANGERALGNVENALDISPKFTVDRVYQAENREITDLIEAGEWNRLNPPDLFSFIRIAHRAEAIDFTRIREWLDHATWDIVFMGTKRRAIPGGKHTPRMDSDLYEREGIGTMSGEELRALFGEGYSDPNILYDGEKVIKPPEPGSNDDPTVIDRMDNSSTDDE